MTRFDIAVVGAGVAGAATALRLQSLGWHVAMLHRPDNVGGHESLSPGVTHELNELAVDVGVPMSEVHGWWGSDEKRQANYPGARVTERALLAEKLRHCAAAAGVQTFRVDGGFLLDCSDGQWLLRFEKMELAAGFVVDATGRASLVGRRFGAVRHDLDQLYSISFLLNRPDVIGTWTESTADGWWSICCASNQGTLSFHSIAPIIREARLNPAVYFGNTRHLRRLFAVGAFAHASVRNCGSSCLTPCSGVNWAAVGDAAWTVQPLASAGVTKALRDARLLSKTLEGRTATYEQFQQDEFQLYLRQIDLHYSLEMRWPESPFWQQRREGIRRGETQESDSRNLE